MNQTYLEKIPIRRIAFTTLADWREKYASHGITLYQSEVNLLPAIRATFVDLLYFVEEQLATQPERADVVHDLLAHLAEQMIAMNKKKQAEMKGFLRWLETETGAPLDDLIGKSYIQNYLGDYQKGEDRLSFDGLLDVLRKNKRKLKTDPGSRPFQERLRKEYTASLDKLLPLKAKLAATDRLIDLIVYRLYGLTEEEEEVVEGREG